MDILIEIYVNVWIETKTTFLFCIFQLIFFESESKNLACAVEIMFDRWVENERDEANKENLIYTLEGLKMDSIIQKVFQ